MLSGRKKDGVEKTQLSIFIHRIKRSSDFFIGVCHLLQYPVKAREKKDVALN